ncbi:MAG: FmdB family zinc ribbon protein [Bacillota bacterium]
MPIYEFKCLNCKKDFEELCAVGSTAKCPHCSSANTQKKLSVFSAKSAGSEGTRSIGESHSCGSCHSHHCGSCH